MLLNCFEKENIFVKLLATFNDVLVILFRLYKIELILQLNNKLLFASTSYTKICGSDERLIQFLYHYIPCYYSHELTLNYIRKKYLVCIWRKTTEKKCWTWVQYSLSVPLITNWKSTFTVHSLQLFNNTRTHWKYCNWEINVINYNYKL